MAAGCERGLGTWDGPRASLLPLKDSSSAHFPPICLGALSISCFFIDGLI